MSNVMQTCFVRGIHHVFVLYNKALHWCKTNASTHLKCRLYRVLRVFYRVVVFIHSLRPVLPSTKAKEPLCLVYRNVQPVLNGVNGRLSKQYHSTTRMRARRGDSRRSWGWHYWLIYDLSFKMAAKTRRSYTVLHTPLQLQYFVYNIWRYEIEAHCACDSQQRRSIARRWGQKL